MTDVKESEGFKSLSELFVKFKKFHFDLARKVDYPSIPKWIDFADGKVEKVLDEEKSIVDNIKDMYIIYILWTALSIIGLWYMWAIYGAIFGTIFLAVFLNPIAIIAAVVIMVLFLLSPVIGLLWNSSLYYIVARALGGKGSFRQTMSILVNSTGASMILSAGVLLSYAIIIGFFISPLIYAVLFYVVYLQYKGIKHVHKLSRNRSIGVIVGSMVVGFVLYFALILGIYLGAIALMAGVLYV
ncbi:YIP1 family protein [Candidatus Micrarchaeota archaeon]|nr:YIP1 family protein [Candidatus Micrarchaeota archaeon]MBU1681653.1 YIP1 family protein [Candidatus Micrarchaeota archaeon]